MHVDWYGQSAFRLSTPDTTVFIDPIGDVSGLAARGLQFDYPPVEGVAADLLLVTHEHMDHNGVDQIDGIRVSHFGDFGQASLRPEQAAAIGGIDLLFIPVGAGPTIGAPEATAIIDELEPRWIVPMHYRTPRIGFLEPADKFLERMPHVHKLDTPAFATEELPSVDGPLVIVPAAP